jgi:hypothetical protein
MPKVKVDGILAGILAVALGVTGQAAPAQLAPGVSGSTSTETFGHDEAMRLLSVFGNCYARRYEADALALVATEPGSRAEAETYRRLFRRGNQACLVGAEDTEMRMPVALVRGAIAEGLYKNHIALPANLALAMPEAGTVRTLSEAARCYTGAHRDQARDLIENTQPGTRDELAALNRIAPDFYRCVPDTARRRGFQATQLRFRLAEALWRMPAASATAAATGGAR